MSAELPEIVNERRMFDHEARLMGGTVPWIACVLELWGKSKPGGSFGAQCFIMANALRREQKLREAAQIVHDKFKRDIEQGFKTRDKEYAIDMLGKALKK